MKNPFPSTPAGNDDLFSALQDDSPHADIFFDLFGGELTPELPSKTETR